MKRCRLTPLSWEVSAVPSLGMDSVLEAATRPCREISGAVDQVKQRQWKQTSDGVKLSLNPDLKFDLGRPRRPVV